MAAQDSKASLVPGLALPLVLAVAAMYLHQLPFPPLTMGDGRHPIDAILVAIALGMILRNFFTLPKWLGPGIKYAVVSLLPASIVLLGAKLDFYDIARISGKALFINVVCVSAAFALTVWLCRKMKVSQKLAILIAAGTAICGGTAIAVTAPVIEAEESDTAFSVTTITLLGLIAIPVFPIIGAALGLSQTEFGVWAGTSIHATPQVMAAGFAYGQSAGDTAVVVKLVRVLLLAPIVVGIGMWYARHKRGMQQAHVAPRTSFSMLFPPFIFGFVLMALANTLNLLPDFTLHLDRSPLWESGERRFAISALVTAGSSFLVTMAMAGVGLGADFRSLRRTGPVALLVGLFAAIVMALLSLVLLKAFL